MTIKELLNELSEQGVKLWTDGEQLRIRANKGVITPEKRQMISEYKAEILEQLRQNNIGASTASLPVIVPQPEKRYEPFPMTDIQYAFWVGRMGVLELGDVANHGYYEIEAVGLNLKRLNQALNKIIQRHDMLRAVMLAEGLQQVLEKVPTYEISTLDLRGENEDVAQARILEIRDIMSHQVLPADKWPLFEFRASILEQQRLRLHISYDLQIFDAWSMMRLFEEWFEVYENPEILLKPLEITFRDYVLAEQALEKTELYERSRQYWLNRIDSLPPAPDLPLALNPNSIKDYQCQRFRGKLDKTTWQKLKKRAGEAGLTPSAVLLAAFADVLTFWGKSPQFTMNLALFNRLPLHPHVNNILGDFTSVTLLAVDNSATETFTKRALRLQRQLWQDLEHRYFSGVRVMREINRRQGQTPTAMPVVFTSAIGFDALGQENSSLFRFGELVYAISQASQVWMDHQVSEQNGELVFTWDAVAALFPEGMISDMFDGYYSLIRNLANSDVAWSETTRQGMMPENQLLQRKNINATEKLISDATLYSLFAEQVQVRRNEVGVIARDSSLTYHELSELSIQLGGKLQHLGAAPNRLVAVVMEKGWEQIVGVLGVLAAGAAYVPFNPKEPKERLQYLLSNSEAEIVLTQSWLTDIALPENIKRIDVDTFSSSPTDNFPSPVTAHSDDLAYVIYTSGSTGLPKGVMITHRNVVNVVVNTNQRFQVGVDDKILAVTALNHDLSVYDIFGLLAAGGTIVMPDAERVKDPSHWIELINQEGITLWNSVPPMMEMLVEYATDFNQSLSSTLRLAIMGGDWLPVSLPTRLRKLVKEIEILSIGGPTETTIWNIGYLIKEVDPNWKSIPYGQPMVNSKYYILSENLEDCPMWVPGQMYCAGVQVAKGYWHNEEKTNASFITHPRTGERIYGTGDLGRYLPDGNIEFVGRADFQIKIRGHRVETGEIEAALTKHSEVKSAIVKAFGKDDKQRLVAYLIPSQKPEPTIAEISQFLQDKLPEYMIPSAYIFLDKFPLSANGKIDRRSLPQPEGNFSIIEVNYVAPKTKIEQTIVEIWQEVLELEKVGVNDNFFDLGGNSLQVTKIYNQLREALPNEFQNISLVDVFKYPTISKLSEQLSHDSDINIQELIEQKDENLKVKIQAGKNRIKARLNKSRTAK
ncbi:amino acid adenylation domain-containing protein [Dapis sp. BLCC M126]|uniref:non-ribosomal peptide synthetase n=1 Tax=Dapis sp. BLCC M126 TaxID=3400189 RepID=UPI003CF5C79F